LAYIFVGYLINISHNESNRPYNGRLLMKEGYKSKQQTILG